MFDVKEDDVEYIYEFNNDVEVNIYIYFDEDGIQTIFELADDVESSLDNEELKFLY
jgi:hypothetical protein